MMVRVAVVGREGAAAAKVAVAAAVETRDDCAWFLP
jgi:hypothetical protein